MGLIEKHTLIQEIAPPLDRLLAAQFIDEFISMERRYVQRDWEPTELDGGQFCEALARALYHQDSGQLSLTRDFSDCLKYVEDEKAQIQHLIQPRHDALHIARVLRMVYKFRSQRGAVHISPHYGPNHMDARLLIEGVRWCIAEILRMFWRGDREVVAKSIRELLQFDVPCIGRFEDALVVQRTDLTTEEEVLVLLHYAGEAGFSRKELGQFALRLAPRVTEALQALTSPECREVIFVSGPQRYRLTDLGSKRVREQLSRKLLLE